MMHRLLDIVPGLLVFQRDALYRFDPEAPTHVDGKTEAERELARQGEGVRASVNDVVQMSLSKGTVGMLRAGVSKGERGLAG
jgi:hypothetical protein